MEISEIEFLITSILILALVALVIMGFIFIVIWLRSIAVVPPDEIHVVTSKRRKHIYDGSGRYMFFSFLFQRIIFKKEILIIQVPSIIVNDRENMPLTIALTCNVKMNNPIKTLDTLGRDYFMSLENVINNNIEAILKMRCQDKSFDEIKINRGELERNILEDLTRALMQYGFEIIEVKIQELNRL